jgi:hypothetical protein
MTGAYGRLDLELGDDLRRLELGVLEARTTGGTPHGAGTTARLDSDIPDRSLEVASKIERVRMASLDGRLEGLVIPHGTPARGAREDGVP